MSSTVNWGNKIKREIALTRRTVRINLCARLYDDLFLFTFEHHYREVPCYKNRKELYFI